MKLRNIHLENQALNAFVYTPFYHDVTHSSHAMSTYGSTASTASHFTVSSGSGAVSYTHLDVYKRQVLIGVTLANKHDYAGLVNRIERFDPSFINLNGNETLYNMLV